MKLRNIATLTIAAVLVSATGALAGSTQNTWTNGTSQGTREVNVENIRKEVGNFDRVTENLKIDAVTEPGGFAQSNIQFDGSKFTGSGVANINNGVDPYVNAGRSYNRETGSLRDVTKTNVLENTTFSESFNSHALDTSF